MDCLHNLPLLSLLIDFHTFSTILGSRFNFPLGPFDPISCHLNLLQQSLERLDDASTELMMSGAGDKVMLLIGESFFDTSEEAATEYCEQEVDRLTEQLEALDEEEATIKEEQAELKKALYGRFGKSIQLEA
jgi:prefoldin subunit 4